jgi:hypothetical protein
MTDEEATAYHEAGHAVVGALRNRPPDWVTIIADGGAAGKTEFPTIGHPGSNATPATRLKSAPTSKPVF